MKATVVILASLAGHALAVPSGVSSMQKRSASNVPKPGSAEDICIQASTKEFDQCFKERQRDEPSENLRDRCNKQREESKQRCLNVRVQDGTVVDGAAAREKDSRCAVAGNRAFAGCMKDRFRPKSTTTPETRESRDDCEKKRTEAREACLGGDEQKPAQQKKPADQQTPEACPRCDEQKLADQQTPADIQKPADLQEPADQKTPADQQNTLPQVGDATQQKTPIQVNDVPNSC